ncbi:MAG: multifunctional oxoglutarate decarboxylase/oxoglutarate dehydrogenase thiamine pyrophosphate-binding subunit/dihydrolipoyllysine-residue succinyltransferase subunit [Mycobacteriales bacterium]
MTTITNPSQASDVPGNQSSGSSIAAEFGANEWIVDEMYQQYLDDPTSVDAAWHEFFADYTPGAEQSAANGQTTAAAPEVKPEPTSRDEQTRTTAASASQAIAMTTTQQSSRAVAAVAQAPTIAAASKTPIKTAPQQTSAPATVTAAEVTPLRGAAARIVANMDASLTVPTATSVRAVPAKLMADNRIVINNHLKRGRGGKVSFTHVIGYALVRALAQHPEMNSSFTTSDGKPALSTPEHINLGLAIDLATASGRSLVVASIKGTEAMDFTQFLAAYEELIRKARAGKLGANDFAGTTISLTNPGGIGTVHSVPRLMQGQGTIVGVGAMEYPAEYSGMSEEAINDLGISKTITLTSTYDHRIIQGAQSGEFLKRMHELLLGADGFYDEVFAALRVPYEPVRWVRDVPVNDDGIDKGARIIELINAYRVGGHFMADTDPLEYHQRRHPDLDILQHGLTLWDLDRSFCVGGFAGKDRMKLRDILGVLRNSYCRRIGVEYMHISAPGEREWIQERVEVTHDKPEPSKQKQILAKLNAAEAFETFLQTKFVGQKRFSLEGGESVIPLLDEVIQEAAEHDLDEVVIGMAHRGRLNVLTNIMGKPYEAVFGEFEGNIDPSTMHGSGDVKYHLGTDAKVATPDGKHTIGVTLTCNPSHLEAVNPVVEGITRARQELLAKGQFAYTVLPLLVHGDAAFAGQGVVAETLNLSQLRGYRTGGTVHVVINNQVGFTTAPEDTRSSLYCTDVARMVQAPIFHVNGDDPEACVRVAQLAFQYRQAFHKDVVIDMVCYRLRGHNEGDDPSMTNPGMYAIIDTKRRVRKLYTEELIGRGDITVDDAEAALQDFQERLEHAFQATKDTHTTSTLRTVPTPAVKPVAPMSGNKVDTAISSDVLRRIGDSQVSWPEGFTPHPRLAPLMEKRRQATVDGSIDWGLGETLAFGSLLLDGRPIRLSGQDSRRGTFVQRHCVLLDHTDGTEYVPLSNLAPDQPRFGAYDSLLSEFAAMGFEYGYSLAHPEALVIWEAQFGDFASGAQSIVDEFISAGEVKWGQQSGVVLLRPHGYEGQGPDHSSGRIERYLQLCAQENMTVANCTTPASYFHLLRWQALRGEHRPLIVFTPKSLLRHKHAVSAVEDFTSGSFQPVLADPGIDGTPLDPAQVTRVLLCSGKVYYDLLARRNEQRIGHTAILRLEQLYPTPVEEVQSALAQYPGAVDHAWVQEEPANQGAWGFMALNLLEHLEGMQLRRISRRAGASPATGSSKAHQLEQAALVEAALPKGA